MHDRIKLAWKALTTGLFTDTKYIILNLEEKVSILEKENFSLITHIKLYQDTLQFERERSKELESIYLKRLGIILPTRTESTEPKNFKPISRGTTAHQMRRDLTLKAQQDYWAKKLKEQEAVEFTEEHKI